MKTSAPVSTLRYHSGASWAALIQHLGSIPKAVVFRTKVDEKVDNSGWRIKIVADVGIPTKLSDRSGCPVEPFFPAAESGP